MALEIDIAKDDSIEIGNGIDEVIKKTCNECTVGYNDDLYADIHLTGNDRIREINREFREIDSSTDVLSFPLLEAKDGRIEYSDLDRDPENKKIILGDIIISVEKAVSQAQEYGHSVEREMAFLVCHGMLHLLGYDHDDKEREELMTGLQKDILDNLGYIK